MKIELGKYTYIFDEKTGVQEALRHGEPWRKEDLVGDNLVLAMAMKIEELQQELDNLNDDLEVAIKNAIESGSAMTIVNAINRVMDDYVARGLLDSDTTSTRPAKYFKGVAANNNPIYNAAGSIRIEVLT